MSRFWILCCLFVAPLSVQAQKPLEIVDLAIEGTAGKAQNLDKLRVTTSTMKGTFFTASGPISADKETFTDWPGNWRTNFLLTIEGTPRLVSLGMSGETRWRKASGQDAIANPDDWPEVIPDIHIHWLSTLAPLKTGDVRLSSLEDSKINGLPVAGIRVAATGKPDVSLWFDRKSWLLVKAECDTRTGGVKIHKSLSFSGHQDFSGIRLPTKIIEMHDTRKMIEWAVTDYRFPEKSVREVFTRP